MFFNDVMRLQEKYTQEIVPMLMKELRITNRMAVPRLLKVVINCGLGEALKDKNVLSRASEQIAMISGQKPQVTRAKRAISSFKLRAGDHIGLKTTLRGKRMYDFIARLATIALPRVRDFRGISKKGFDGKGNYTLGIREQTIFPEVDYSLVDRIRGIEVTFVTSAKMDTDARRLLELLGLPFEKE